MTTPIFTLSTVTLAAPDPLALAEFYQRLLGGSIEADDPQWVVLRPSAGAPALAFQGEPDHRPPVWPPRDGEQQMQVHLEIRVDDLAAAVDHAISCGAVLAGHQPQDDVRVCLDPAGHPFCLWAALSGG